MWPSPTWLPTEPPRFRNREAAILTFSEMRASARAREPPSARAPEQPPSGRAESAVARAERPARQELYKEQLASPIAVFQLLCCVLWMLDEYWK